jgi:hypothetical protein
MNIRSAGNAYAAWARIGMPRVAAKRSCAVCFADGLSVSRTAGQRFAVSFLPLSQLDTLGRIFVVEQ